MKKYLLLLFLCSPFYFASGQGMLKAVNGEVSFYSHALLEDIKATSKQVNSFINMGTGEVVFIIPMRSFHFAKSLMEEHFNEKYIESEKYPQATYKGIINEKIDFSNPGSFSISAKGRMNIHGRENELTESGQIEIRNDTVVFETKFFVAIKDYNIAIPKLLFQNIGDTVEVTLKTFYIPNKKIER